MAKQEPKSLSDFMKEKERASCPVCQLPEEVRAQLGTSASRKGFSRADQIDWLHNALGATEVTAQALNRHFNARHEEVT